MNEENLGVPPEALPQGFGLDALFASVMDTMVPEEAQETADTGAAATSADAGAAGPPAPATEAAGDPGSGDGGQTPTDGVDPQLPAEGGAGAAATQVGTGPGVGAVDYSVVAPSFGKISTGLEERTAKLHQEAALTEMRAQYGKYFEQLQKHPRQLVGQQVPSINGREGMETLRDSQDAADWQGAVKQLLTNELRDRASRMADADRQTMDVLHSSIGLFQNNSDLVPGTKQFNRELADQFGKIAKPYELRVDGKLQGWSIPVQPLIDQLRQQLAEQAKANPPTPAPTTKAPAPTTKTPAPQRGLQSRAGASTEEEDYSTFFGTLGPQYRNLRI